MSEFGNQLKFERAQDRRTQAEVARVIGVTPAYVSEVERGCRLPFRHDQTMEIASYLGCDPAALLMAAWKTRGAVPVEFVGDLQDCAARAIEADVEKQGA